MNRIIRLAAFAAPVLGLGALWAVSECTYHQGTEWDVPIQGYDPRDYLRGHYVEFTYDWNRLWVPSDFNPPIDALCISGQAPLMDGVTQLRPGNACAHPLRIDGGGVYGSNALMTGRLYIGQHRAAALEERLRNRDQRGIVTIRQRDDGSFAPISIRFRPLTPEEIADRDAQTEAPFMPPAIMDAPIENPRR